MTPETTMIPRSDFKTYANGLQASVVANSEILQKRLAQNAGDIPNYILTEIKDDQVYIRVADSIVLDLYKNRDEVSVRELRDHIFFIMVGKIANGGDDDRAEVRAYAGIARAANFGGRCGR